MLKKSTENAEIIVDGHINHDKNYTWTSAYDCIQQEEIRTITYTYTDDGKYNISINIDFKI